MIEKKKDPEILVTDMGRDKIFLRPWQKKIDGGLQTPPCLGLESNFKK